MTRKLTELERAVYEMPDGRLCVLVLVVGAAADGAGRRDLAREGERVQVCILEDGAIPPNDRLVASLTYVDPGELSRVGELVDARSMAS